MATLATVQANPAQGTRIYTGGVGVNDNDVAVQANDVREFREFLVMTTAGAADITVSLDGTNYSTAPLSLDDMGGIAIAVPVLVTVALRIYRFRGTFRNIRVLQNGATAITAVALVCSTG